MSDIRIYSEPKKKGMVTTMHQRKRPNFHRPLALLLALALCLTMAAPALAAENAIASSIQLSKTEGTVSATNSAGRSISLIKNLRL